jgi:hypothetical protein
MPNEILHKNGTPVVFADTTDYSSTNSGFTRTAQLDLTSIANNAARQSDKVDLGTTRPRLYAVRVGIEYDVAPTAGNTSEFYWSSSQSVTAGTGNDGGCSGADGAYKAAEEDEWKRQLIFLGALISTNDAATTVQYSTVGYFTPPHRYGQIVYVNKSGQALEGDAVEMFVALIPITDEIQ